MKETSTKDLSQGVAKSEGVNGSTLTPIYQNRQIHCYQVTDSELQQIGLANIGITATASIGSAFFAFWLDIFKDTMLANEIPPTAREVIAYVQPVCLLVAASLWIVAGLLFFWRSNMIKTIKKESV